MPRKNRNLQRLQIFVPPSLDALLVELAALNGVNVSSLVRDLLETLEPGIRTSLDMIKASRLLDVQAKEGLSTTLQKHADKLRKDTEYVMEAAKKEIENL